MIKILVIDDNEDNLIIISNQLKAVMPRCSVSTALTGEEGLEMVRRDAPDTILLDIHLPGLDGFQVCHSLKSSLLTDSIPVFLISAGEIRANQRVRGLDSGVDGFLCRPLDLDELKAQINAGLRRKKEKEELRREKENLENILKTRTDELNMARSEAAGPIKSALLANLSHEFRTPLNGIMGITEILYNEAHVPEQMELLNLIRLSGKRLFTTLDSFIKLAQLTAGEYRTVLKPLSCSRVADRTIKKFVSLAKGKDLLLSLEIRKDSEVMSNEEMINDILQHLIDNAIKFTHRGEVKVVIDRCDMKGLSHVTFSVRDSGIGIPSEHHENLFSRFRQISEGVSRGYQGCGLGLALVRKMTEFLGGTLTLQSVVGNGSTFTVALPARPVVDNAHPVQNMRYLAVKEKPPATVFQAQKRSGESG